MIYVQMTGITKRFPGVLANDQVNLELHSGEIHGLLGENGAGKTTLMNILFGLYRPDAGQILLRGQPLILHSPADAIRCGIGMVHQHFKLVPPFSVTENVILGLGGSFLINIKAAQRQVTQVAEQYGLKIDPAAQVQQLSVGEQQRVEIVSSLFRGAEVLILDEPTAVLTPQEAESLAVGLKKMAEQGKVIVFISHKLEEVLKLTDRVTVLRAGRVVFSSMTKDTNKAELAREMIGREFTALKGEQAAVVLALAGAQDTKLAKDLQASARNGCLLEVTDLHVTDDRGLDAVRGVSFEVRRGEVLGIAGVDGNGQRELVEAIVRLRKLKSGRVVLNGEDTAHWNMQSFIQHRTAYIPDDRQNDGLILGFDLNRNATLKVFERPPFARHGLINRSEVNKFTRRLMEAYDVRAPGPQARAGTLSGGNQQKLVLARELSQEPSLLIANQPTRGLDIGAAAYIHQMLLDERERGAGILLISADLDEILLLSSRILVMYNGRSMGILETRLADIQTIGLMMAGTPLAELKTPEASS
jgi:ABC-type uncharacterized transport system ATPase subunit